MRDPAGKKRSERTPSFFRNSGGAKPSFPPERGSGILGEQLMQLLRSELVAECHLHRRLVRLGCSEIEPDASRR